MTDDAKRLDELDGWLEDGGGGVFDAADAAIFIARRLLADNERLRDGIENLEGFDFNPDGHMEPYYKLGNGESWDHGEYVETEALRALLGDS